MEAVGKRVLRNLPGICHGELEHAIPDTIVFPVQARHDANRDSSQFFTNETRTGKNKNSDKE